MNNNLIERKQNFTLNRKIVYIDSNDRDVIRFPDTNTFQISLPQTYNYVESIRLLYIQTVSNIYNISNYLQNNILYFRNSNNNIVKITLLDGCYNNDTLVTAIKNQLDTNLLNISVKYSKVTNKIYFINTGISASNYMIDCTYSNINDYNTCNNYCVFNQHSNWGLGYILGFNKKRYQFINPEKNFFLIDPPECIINTSDHNFNGHSLIEPHNIVNIYNDSHIYLSLDNLNKGDTLYPYINNKSNVNIGNVNSVFAQIPIINSDNMLNYNSNDCLLNNMSYFQPPLEKLERLNIRFTYHNGMPVEFKNTNIVMTLEINQIKNEIKNYDVRTPFTI
tara:strand:+ start:768 stop:1772 length:1005 start_codon:yes stop_codon:yes gene_type:complete